MPKLGKIKEQKEKKSYKIYGVRREEELNRLEKDDLPSYAENFHPLRYDNPKIMDAIKNLKSDGQL